MKKTCLSPVRPLLGGLVLLLSVGAASAQQAAPATLLRDGAAQASPLAAALQRARPLTLDVAAASATLAAAPLETQSGAAPVVLALPLPDGSTGRFAVWQTSVMAPTLAARYPDIHTYAGQGLDDASATVRLDLTPAGFHAQILSATTGTVYIDPARRGDTRNYVSFYKHDIRPDAIDGLDCGFKPAKAAAAHPTQNFGVATPAAVGSGSLLRTYRVAVAATGEYSTFHGGTVPLAQAAIVTSVNRVVGVYEKELAVRLVLVPDNDRLVYLNPATDPYTNDNGGELLDENQALVDSLIGPANYDIGHVFSTGGGGVAGYAVVCRTGLKAQGVTGSSSPVADAFDIDYVAHEMGHQFSGSHPFNGSSGNCNGGNREDSAAWEPGSGSTIMAYAGICAPQNLQPNSDAFFHVGNYEEMRGFIVASTCPTTATTGNRPPTVSGPASGLTLPSGTPFRLTAIGTDADGDPLLYSWEEIDRGTTGSPTAAQTADNNVPLFRSFVPSTSPTRYFPRLADVVSNTATIGERLPTVSRRLTFKCTARDQHRGPVGVIGGVTSSDSVKLRVTSAAGPFLVAGPNTALSWDGASTQTVTWDVAGTTTNGVNCASVNIRLSTDGGFTYPTALALGVPNNGTATIKVPSVTTTTARVMVEAVGNYFFDISDANFTIVSPSVCAPATALAVGAITNTSASVSFAPGAGGTQYVVTTTPATTTRTVTASPVALTGLAPGTVYTVSIVTSCGSSSTSAAATARFTTTAPPPCSAPSELAARNITLTSATISFVGAAATTSYTVSTVPATTTQTVTGSPVTLSGLMAATNYVVRIAGSCAAGATAPVATLALRTLSPPPANDRCAAALPLTCGVRVQGTTEGSTATGDPTTFCGVAVNQGGVFYTLRGTGGDITVSTCGTATNYDSKMFVYTGVCGGPYTCVGGNDDAGCGEASAVTFPSVAGASYLVMVSGYDTETGTFGLLATCAPLSSASRTADAAFRVWPNPAGADAAFHVELPTSALATTISLHNLLGQRVAQRTFSGAATKLPTTGLASGTYLLTVQVAGQAPAVRRVVVE